MVLALGDGTAEQQAAKLRPGGRHRSEGDNGEHHGHTTDARDTGTHHQNEDFVTRCCGPLRVVAILVRVESV